MPGLKFQVGEWVRLKHDLPTGNNRGEPVFKAKELVQIYAHEPEPKSETKREGQPTEWSMTDSDTLYRFLKIEWVNQDAEVNTPPSGPGIVPHAALASTPGGVPDPIAYKVDALVYTKRTVSVRVGTRQDMEVPVGTRGRILNLTTRVSGVRKPGQIVPQDVTKCFYHVAFMLREYQLRETRSSHKKEASNFEKITEEERDAHLQYLSKPKKARHFVHYPA
ncbi:hypothetical protein ACG7TL_005129 [Trametes sanguinea]